MSFHHERGEIEISLVVDAGLLLHFPLLLFAFDPQTYYLTFTLYQSPGLQCVCVCVCVCVCLALCVGKR